jgi:dTDP-4-amino-4,6-dideoxygalactose transaminase
MLIPFNKPYLCGNELKYIEKAHSLGKLAGDGPFTEKCHDWLKVNTSVKKVLLTHSCTAALEISALLLRIRPGDEIIMPSFTFVSTANAFALRGGVPVFVDIRKDTLNIDENLIEQAITPKTRAILVVHYAGIACEMNTIMKIAKQYSLKVIEDAAQGIMGSYRGKKLGSIGDLGCFSFHETKNIHCGEGGALMINNEKFIERAQIIREKGTDRTKFFEGKINRYQWVDIGSSYLPGELTAAFLFAQLENAKEITEERLSIWHKYHKFLEELEKKNKIIRPIVPKECSQNGHIYYIILQKKFNRNAVIKNLKEKGINAVFHYQPLHSSPAGLKYGKCLSTLEVTEDLSRNLVRLPMWIGMDKHEKIVNSLKEILSS